MKRSKALLLVVIFTTFVILSPPLGLSSPLSRQNEGCEECHSEFEAITFTIDAPKEVPENYEFDYKVIVKNQWKHTVQNLEAVIILSGAPQLELISEAVEPYHEEISDSVTAGSTATFSFPVVENASNADIILDGDNGIAGLNDIDLVVTSPNGRTWESMDSGADEAVGLDADDMRRGGYGEYTAEVQYFVGRPSISFTLTIDVEYDFKQVFLKGPDLAPDGKYTFVIPLRSTVKGENTIGLYISCTAYHEHEEPGPSDSEDYAFEDTSQVTVGDKLVYQAPTEEDLGSNPVMLLERVSGLLSVLLLILSIGLCGFIKPLNTRIETIVGGARKRVKIHCRVSLLLLLISFVHGILMPFSPYAATGRGAVLGTSAFVILGMMGFVGWQQNMLKKRWGRDKWRRIHLILMILAVIQVVVHALLEGSDFAWLR